MMLRTHLAFAAFIIILFINKVVNPFIFVIAVVVATTIPDLDSGFSSWGRHWIFKPLQILFKHRGPLHSISLGFLISLVLSFIFPQAAFGFFLGYALHVFIDSFTKEGVRPFWPLKGKSKSFLVNGGKIEDSIFVSMIMIDVFVAIMLFIF